MERVLAEMIQDIWRERERTGVLTGKMSSDAIYLVIYYI